jgi:ATP-dependent protease HslVU (ClpYQ) peptidase subunit
MLSNQKIINEIKDITDSFINTRPKMEMNSFVSSQRQPYNLGDRRGNQPVNFLKGGGAPGFMKHPLPGGNNNGNTLHPDPLFSGVTYKPILNLEKGAKGGAILAEKMPLTGGFYSESDSDYDSELSDSDSEFEGGDLMSESSEGEYSSDDEGEIGGGIYDDYVKPAGKALSKGLYDVGKFAFNDVVIPAGKEVLKKAILGAMMGAGHMEGGLSGTKAEFIHILKKMYPNINFKNMKKEEIVKKIKEEVDNQPLEEEEEEVVVKEKRPRVKKSKSSDLEKLVKKEKSKIQTKIDSFNKRRDTSRYGTLTEKTEKKIKFLDNLKNGLTVDNIKDFDIKKIKFPEEPPKAKKTKKNKSLLDSSVEKIEKKLKVAKGFLSRAKTQKTKDKYEKEVERLGKVLANSIIDRDKFNERNKFEGEGGKLKKLIKGSAEAKAKMAKIRAMKKSN